MDLPFSLPENRVRVWAPDVPGPRSHGRGRDRCSPASSVLTVSSLLGSLRPILLKEYMRMLYTDAGCRSTMLAWLMVGEMLRVDCLKSQESAEGTPFQATARRTPSSPPAKPQSIDRSPSQV